MPLDYGTLVKKLTLTMSSYVAGLFAKDRNKCTFFHKWCFFFFFIKSLFISGVPMLPLQPPPHCTKRSVLTVFLSSLHDRGGEEGRHSLPSFLCSAETEDSSVSVPAFFRLMQAERRRK